MIHRTYKICSLSKVGESIKLLKQTFINNWFSSTVFDHILNEYRSRRDESSTTSVDAEIHTNVDTEVREPASNVVTSSDVETRADASNGQGDQTIGDQRFPHHNHQSLTTIINLFTTITNHSSQSPISSPQSPIFSPQSRISSQWWPIFARCSPISARWSSISNLWLQSS